MIKDDKKSRKINFNNPGNVTRQRTDLREKKNRQVIMTWKNNSSENIEILFIGVFPKQSLGGVRDVQ